MRAGLVAASSGATLLILEIALRVVAPQIFAPHPAGMYSLDPDVGYVLTPHFRGVFKHAEFVQPVNVNGLGLRGPEVGRRGDADVTVPRETGVDPPRQSQVLRILLLGDSQTWGYGVAEDETYAAQLQKLLSTLAPERPVEVLNAGVPGYGTADELAFLRSRIDRLQPDLVIVQFLSVNDLVENRAPAARWATLIGGMLASREPESAPALEKARRWVKGHSHLGRLVLETGGYLGVRLGLLRGVDALWGEDFSDEDAALGIQLLVEIAETAAEDGAKTLLLYTTGQGHVLTGTYRRPRSAVVVETAAQRAGVPWIDVSERLQQRADRADLYFAHNGHWTAAGHAAVAETLSDALIESGLLQQDQRQP